ncbi:hypothetical protein EI94DRAFT_1706171 [Lactarius quietus]|nr:hypothetical protein EI94DRAFT_1706171 [Lactarius quietus]
MTNLREPTTMSSVDLALTNIPAGHWTWTSIAYDLQRKKHVLLKDSWWVLLDNVTPEVHASLVAGVLHHDISIGNIMIIDNKNEREDLCGVCQSRQKLYPVSICALNWSDVHDNPNLSMLINGLKKGLGIQYWDPPSKPEAFNPLTVWAQDKGLDLSMKVRQDGQKKEYKSLKKCLGDYHITITQFHRALNAKGWPTSDAAKKQPLLTSNRVGVTMRSGSKSQGLEPERMVCLLSHEQQSS